MFLHVVKAEYIGGYKIKVTFSDGRTGIADLSSVLHGPVFEPLKDHSFFSRLEVDETLATVVWPNGADLAPEYLYYLAFKDDKALESLFQQWGYRAPRNIRGARGGQGSPAIFNHASD